MMLRNPDFAVVFLLLIKRLRLAALILVLLAVGACESADSDDPAATLSRIPIHITTVQEELFSDTLETSGITQATNEASLSFQARGQVVQKNFRVGAVVAAGEILAQLDNPDTAPAAAAAQQQWQAALARFKQAQANAKRFEKLLAQAAITQQEYEAVRQNVDSARAQERAAKASADGFAKSLDELKLRAPFDGVVTADHLALGGFVQAGQAVVEVIDPSSVEVVVALSSQRLDHIDIGDSVDVKSSLSSDISAVKGKVTHKSPFTSAASLPELVVSLPSQRIDPGVAVDLEFKLKQVAQFRLPVRALFRIADEQSAVYKIVDGVARLVSVRPRSISVDRVIIDKKDAALKQGDMIATDGVSKLFDGALVEVL